MRSRTQPTSVSILSRDDVLQNPLHKNQTEVMIPTLHRSRTFYTSKTLDDSDRALILKTLEQARWVVGGPLGAAAKLGLKRTTLLSIMRRLDISRPIHQEGTDERGIASETIRWEGAHFRNLCVPNSSHTTEHFRTLPNPCSLRLIAVNSQKHSRLEFSVC